MRAEQTATLERLTHERFTSARTGELIAAAAAELNGEGAGTVDARIVSEARRLYEKECRVPLELAVARARAASEGYVVWVAARAADDFSSYLPALERNIQLARDYASCFDGHGDPYDPLLDDYAPGMTTAQVSGLFAEMRSALVPLIERLRDHDVDRSPLHVRYPVPGQRRVVDQVLRWMGFEDSAWRLDDTVHPFESSFSVTDIRLTTRYEETYFPTALYGGMHECGHGLYEAGIDRSLERTVLGRIRSSAMHESQSRLWENMVGRSRAFCGTLAGLLAEHSQGALSDLDPDVLFRAVNAVVPSPIRIEADETTYGLHIVLRFELEHRLITGEISAPDLPDAWDAGMREYLGVEVPSDADGVMQDVHWSAGLFGYFPTYAVGNLIAGQLWEQVHAEIPDLEDQLAEHRLGALREWLRDRVHRHGSRYSDTELLRQIVGGPVRVDPFINHLRTTLSQVYGLDLA